MSRLKRFKVTASVTMTCTRLVDAFDEDDAEDQVENLKPEEWAENVESSEVEIDWITKQ